ncbi:MAG: GTPase Era [Ruminococcaceae bacterium]|nr:GTPase Era [Oscillospiraceae bacterium]
MITKSAMITIAGRPNVGKSTLTNAIVGEKVAIVSNKPQTTRNRICGVWNHEDTQIVFMDTPGFHKPRTRLGDYMVDVVKESVADVDAILLVVEPIANIGTQEEELIKQIKSSGAPAILVINKIDTVEKDTLLAVIAVYSQAHDFEAIVPISAKEGDGVQTLLEECCKFAEEGPQLFPDGMVSDQPERQVIAEIIREKLLWCLDKEIPHGTAVEIVRFSERDSGVIDVDATIYCEKASHKGIIIGKQGAMLKKISSMAREDCERFMGAKIFLQTWVKVKENWRDSNFLIHNFGYTND